jgi:hypothetical protein
MASSITSVASPAAKARSYSPTDNAEGSDTAGAEVGAGILLDLTNGTVAIP